MQGVLKKKGIIFYNNRLLILDVKGILKYYDPKNLSIVRGEIDLNASHVSIKLTGKLRDTLEI